ncbi:hypothetical protein G6F32_015569 [Rhizopus arrhizus]|nr:hypothetical protein G6F32_015569 [Rhizopus arrhizus]
MAPDGTRIWPWCWRASSIRSSWRSRAPELSTTIFLPLRSTGSAMLRKTAAGAHSTTTSQCSCRASMVVKVGAACVQAKAGGALG